MIRLNLARSASVMSFSARSVALAVIALVAHSLKTRRSKPKPILQFLRFGQQAQSFLRPGLAAQRHCAGFEVVGQSVEGVHCRDCTRFWQNQSASNVLTKSSARSTTTE